MLGFVKTTKQKAAPPPTESPRLANARAELVALLTERKDLQNEQTRLDALSRRAEHRLQQLPDEEAQLKQRHYIAWRDHDLNHALPNPDDAYKAALKQLGEEREDLTDKLQRVVAQRAQIEGKITRLDSPIRLAQERLRLSVRDYLGQQFEPDFKEKLIRFWAGAGLVRNGTHLETCLVELLGGDRHALDEEVRLKKIALIDEFKII